MSRKVSFKSLGFGAFVKSAPKAPTSTGNFKTGDLNASPSSPGSPKPSGRKGSLEKYTKKTEQRVDKLKLPRTVLKCIEVLDDKGLNTTDLMLHEWQTGPRGKMVRELQRHAETSDFEEFDNCPDMHAVAGVMLSYFYDMHEPVAGYDAYGPMMECAKRSPEETSLKLKLRDVVQRLPKENFFLMKYLSEFLSRVVEAPTNVTSRRLAKVFGPIYLRNYNSLFPKEDKETAATQHAITIVETIITDPQSLFQCDEWETLWNDCTYWREKAKQLMKQLQFIQPDYEKVVAKEKEYRDRIAELEGENKRLRDRIAELEAQSERDKRELEDARKKALEAEDELTQLRIENERLKREVANKDARIEALDTEVARLKAEIERLEELVRDLEKQLARLQDENFKQNNEIEEKTRKIENLLKEIEALKVALGDKNKNVVMSVKELEELKERIRELERLTRDYEAEIARLKLELEELQRLIDEKDALIAQLRRQLLEANDNADQFKGHYEDLIKKHNELLAEVDRLRGHLAAREAMINKLQIELKKKALEIVRWRTESEKWKTEISMPNPDTLQAYREKIQQKKDEI